MKLVDAQQARRVLDRLVGYKLSPLLWQKLSKRWLSAGRVQSVAVRLIVEREREIAKFTNEEYWTIEGVFNPRAAEVIAQLISKDGVKYEKTLAFDLFDGKYTTTTSAINTQSSADGIVRDLKPPFTVSAVDKKEVKRYPYPPYTTSTLQQDAGRKLYFSAKKTMQLAQKLYEEGVITYHRTDSVNLAEKRKRMRRYGLRMQGRPMTSCKRQMIKI
ncbi:MAG: topoisomerase I protein [Candidatus Gottesmanbacteria bacterium GW2011_GWA2_47_9]|uniref:Omega-protein n=1 Tax=Candidatus Gottesmanbacteria bacterium GW2011_GWA2_47_9 TaxID=1618445 RepID=A0A0G1TXP2_9BACT|nr:MAG: topoisomerase I protein [Candidatus Gottesmanbacteria bacterium GW2011_GWA2_47_9]